MRSRRRQGESNVEVQIWLCRKWFRLKLFEHLSSSSLLFLLFFYKTTLCFSPMVPSPLCQYWVRNTGAHLFCFKSAKTCMCVGDGAPTDCDMKTESWCETETQICEKSQKNVGVFGWHLSSNSEIIFSWTKTRINQLKNLVFQHRPFKSGLKPRLPFGVSTAALLHRHRRKTQTQK